MKAERESDGNHLDILRGDSRGRAARGKTPSPALAGRIEGTWKQVGRWALRREERHRQGHVTGAGVGWGWGLALELIQKMRGGTWVGLISRDFFLFWLSRAHGILVPNQGVEPVPLAMEVQSANHWTCREFPRIQL